MQDIERKDTSPFLPEDEKKANSLELSAIYCVNDKWFFSVYDTREKKYYTLELRGKTSEKVPYSVEFFDDETNSISITSALSTQVLKLKERAALPKAAAKPQTQPAAAAQPAKQDNQGGKQQQGNQGGQQQAGGQNQNGGQTPGDNEYYLRRGFDGNWTESGVPFMAAECFSGCGNYLIHGHNMNNGTMFSDLLSYAKKDFCQEHPVIRFDTLEGEQKYQVMAAFFTQVSGDGSNDFPYYQYTDLTNQKIFEEYLAFQFPLEFLIIPLQR